jgi:hypothetical protein
MLYYPQLSTGAVAQYPLRRSALTRSVTNLLADGSAIKLADPDARANRWELRYTGLSDEERSALEQLFRTAEGPLENFQFLDPEGNLLLWSEDATKPVWQNDGMIAVTAADDSGVVRMTNNAQVRQGLEQIIAAPGWYQYCFSAEVNATAPAEVRMSLGNVDGQLVADWIARPEWQSVWCSGAIAGSTDEIACRIELQAGSSVQVRRMQVQAQPMPGAYRRTASVRGVYSARFDQDRIEFRADGVNDHSTTIRIIGRPGA